MKKLMQQLTLGTLLAGVIAMPAFAGGESAAATTTAATPNPFRVLDLPYSATETRTTQRVLADGNNITSEVVTKVYRSSSGQTREDTLGKSGNVVRSVIGPGDGWRYYLDHKTRSANRYEIGASITAEKTPEELAERAEHRRQTVTSQLGERDFEGVVATGTQWVREVPAHAEGNTQPYTQASEMWFAKDLKVTVLRKYNAPQVGEMVTSLSNIERSEPDAALFVLPTGYRGL